MAGMSRRRLRQTPKTEVVRYLKEALRVAQRAEITDYGTDPAFWHHVIRDLRRALENFH